MYSAKIKENKYSTTNAIFHIKQNQSWIASQSAVYAVKVFFKAGKPDNVNQSAVYSAKHKKKL